VAAVAAGLALTVVVVPGRWLPELLGDLGGGDRAAGLEPADPAVELPTTTPPSRARAELVDCDGCERWRLDVAGTVTSLATAGEAIVVGTSTGEVALLDGRSGVARWTTRVGTAPAHASTLGTLVLVGTAGSRVVALAAEDGQPRWDVTSPTATAGARAVAGDDDGVIVVGGAPPGRTAAALDGRTGSPRWSRFLPDRWIGVADTLVVATDRRLEGWSAAQEEPRWTTPLLVDEDLVGRAGDLVVTRDRGGPRFRDPWTGAIVASPDRSVTWWAAAEDGTLLLADTDVRTTVIALERDGRERWRTVLPGTEATGGGCCVEVSPTTDGRVLAVDRRTAGRAALLDLETGDVLADAGRAADAAPGLLLIGATGELGILQGEGSVVGVDIASGETRWRAPDASVVVSLDPLVISGRTSLLAPATGASG
jgi:outer membrane protein assembly factor BamB